MTQFTKLINLHFETIFKKNLIFAGSTPMWKASLNINDGKCENNEKSSTTHYRSINAPSGCNLYYDQILLVSAYVLSKIKGDKSFAEAADRYVNFFLENCVAKNGIFLWGNHYYWDIFRNCVVKFTGSEIPQPVDLEKETGDYHETRPIPPAWDIFWKACPEKTIKEIKNSGINSLFDSKGGFNRHSDRRKGCAFLESGGILVSSFSWLYSKTNDHSLVDIADKIVDFSYSHRDKKTSLVENNPTVERWDKFVSTTEIGLWGNCLLKAAQWTGKHIWIDIVKSAVSAYLEYGYDEDTRKYLGQILVSTGKTPFENNNDTGSQTPYQPGKYSDTWKQFFPSHDYPLQFAECCLELYQITGDELFRVACIRWADQIMDDYTLYKKQNKIIYAERYGRCIHFLWRCWKILKDKKFFDNAKYLTEESIKNLFYKNFFASHTKQNRYDSVDGLGYLFLSLMCMEKDNEVCMMGSFW